MTNKDISVPRESIERAALALSWALDLIDGYDDYLVNVVGDPVETVHSAVHEAGKAKARNVLALLEDPQ